MDPHGVIPDYIVRVSPRAKRVRLTVGPRDGLVVVVPCGFDPRQVPGIVLHHAQWARSAIERNAERAAHLTAHDNGPVPARIEMPGIGVAWDVVMRPGEGDGVRGRASADEIVLTGEIGDHSACYDALRRAVARIARQRLPLMLGGIEAETGWSASNVSVRRQRSRWGSCSAAAAVSLNEALVFLPPSLVRYVLIHELAHTRRMDHSSAYWKLVEQHDAAWRTQRRALREAWRHVPGWADPSS